LSYGLDKWEKLKNRYKILKTLGHRFYGIAYLVEDETIPKKLFAIKTLSDRLLVDKDRNRFRERLIEEVARLHQCNNPHIVRIEEVFIEEC